MNAQDIVALRVEFEQHKDWAEVLDIARTQDKIIFIDVYTDWCGPCKMMDRDVFTDDKLSTHFNSEFINYKINAEKGGLQLAQQYEVKAFPTMLFISSDGDLIYRQVGALTDHELLQRAIEVQRFWDNRAVYKSIGHNPDLYSLEEIKEMLSNSQGFDFEGKADFAKKYLIESTPISDESLELTLDQMEFFDIATLHKIAPMIGSFLPSQVIHDRIGRKKIKWRNQMMAMVDTRIQNSIRVGDFRSFEEAISVDLLLGHLKERDIDRFYYEYYRANDLDKFAVQAEYMMTKHVLAAPVDRVRQEDIKRHAELSKMRRDQNLKMNLVEEIENSSTPTLDSVNRIYNISESIANQLYEVSGDFYAFFDDPIKRKKAERWAEASYAYYPYDLKLYQNHITILESIGDHEKIRRVNNQFKSLPYYNEMLKRQNDLQSEFAWPE